MALKDIMSQTVDAVLEDGDDGVIEQPVSLGDRLAALAQRWRERRDGQKRRPRFQDTEQLFDQPEDEAEEEEPLEPEPLAEDLLRDEKRRCRRLRRGLLTALLPGGSAAGRRRFAGTGAAAVPVAGRVHAAVRRPGRRAAADGPCCVCPCGSGPWSCCGRAVWLRAVRRGGGADPAAVLRVRHGDGSTVATPYAAAGALLTVSCQWGLYLEAETRRSAYHLLVLNGQPPYMVSVTAAGVCKQRGKTEGFYRLTEKADPARLWQNYVLPLLLSAAVVLAGVVCLSGQGMTDFPWVLTSLVTAGMGVAIPLTGVLPLFYLSRRLGRSGCAAAGYAGARAVSRPNPAGFDG